MRTKLRPAIAWVLVTALAACGPKKGGGGRDTSTAAGGVAAVLGTQLAKAKSCSPISPTQQALDQAKIDAMASALQGAVDAGHLAYSRSETDACVGWLASLSCAEFDHDIVNAPGMDANAHCAAAFTGRIANGDACQDDGECTDGYCAFGSSCPGTCTAHVASGDPCQGNDAQCGPGMACLSDGSQLVCMTQPVPVGDGQPCPHGNRDCAPGNYCDGSATPTCRTQLSDGQTCTGSPGNECAAGLACAAGQCRRLVGEGADCSVPRCGPGFYCSSTAARCFAMPVAGGDCNDPNAAPGYLCLDNSYCMGTCLAGTVAVGGACSFDMQGLCALPANGATVSCVHPPGPATCCGTCTVTSRSSCY